MTTQPAANNHDGMAPLGFMQRSLASASKRENARWECEHKATIEREIRTQQQSDRDRDTMMRGMIAVQLAAAAG